MKIFSVMASALLLATTLEAAEVAELNLATPVLLTADGGQEASAFYVNTSNNLFLVTARHVLFNQGSTNLVGRSCTLLSWTHQFSSTNRYLIKLDLASLYASGEIVRHQDRDVAIVRIATISNRWNIIFGRYTDQIVKPEPDSPIVSVSAEQFAPFNNTKVSRDVVIFGYPSSLGIQQIPQLEHDRPLIRKGVLAGKNFEKSLLIVDAAVFYGNSGGPVLEIDSSQFGSTSFRLIGLVSQFVPFEEQWLNLRHGIKNAQISNSGYAVVEPTDSIIDLITGFEINETDAQNNRLEATGAPLRGTPAPQP